MALFWLGGITLCVDKVFDVLFGHRLLVRRNFLLVLQDFLQLHHFVIFFSRGLCLDGSLSSQGLNFLYFEVLLFDERWLSVFVFRFLVDHIHQPFFVFLFLGAVQLLNAYLFELWWTFIIFFLVILLHLLVHLLLELVLELLRHFAVGELLFDVLEFA